ncbi:hypothetical protein H6F93_01700 [Leptolyngbya sp. FACHB-671]|uniref:hypothetical protein n=1 Tax=Leptolyngbya sp. FACHB-671 TaxID=2692812 RepID=UPI001688C29E|nr:hypothetical protein [Leptolyngbya sp. FACHB-671]MBD2066253.1 hypothetical protein [Leptolyngbya sp. FACHB-671]
MTVFIPLIEPLLGWQRALSTDIRYCITFPLTGRKQTLRLNRYIERSGAAWC